MARDRDQLLVVEWPPTIEEAMDPRGSNTWHRIEGWKERWESIAITEIGEPPGFLSVRIDGSLCLRGLTKEETAYIKGDENELIVKPAP